MNPPSFTGSISNEDSENFVEELKKFMMCCMLLTLKELSYLHITRKCGYDFVRSVEGGHR